jgi:hypothetical protein
VPQFDALDSPSRHSGCALWVAVPDSQNRHHSSRNEPVSKAILANARLHRRFVSCIGSDCNNISGRTHGAHLHTDRDNRGTRASAPTSAGLWPHRRGCRRSILREYLALPDGSVGQDLPRQYDDSNFDHVSQIGPAARFRESLIDVALRLMLIDIMLYKLTFAV